MNCYVASWLDCTRKEKPEWKMPSHCLGEGLKMVQLILVPGLNGSPCGDDGFGVSGLWRPFWTEWVSLAL